MRKNYVCGKTIISFDTLDWVEGTLVALSFYPVDGKMPGFNMCFPLERWKDFQREVADYEPEK